jgi:hypothetical protein
VAIACVCLAIALLAQPSRLAQGLEPWFGLWTLNLVKSTYVPGPPPYARAQYAIEPWKDGVKVTYDMVYPRGGTTHWEWTGKFDGQPYPLQGIDEHVTYAYQHVDDRIYDVVVRIDDRRAGVSRVALAADGKTITTTTSGRDASGRVVTTTTVYERAAPSAR